MGTLVGVPSLFLDVRRGGRVLHSAGGQTLPPCNGGDGYVASVCLLTSLLLPCFSNGPLIGHLSPKLGAIRVNTQAVFQMMAKGSEVPHWVPGLL